MPRKTSSRNKTNNKNRKRKNAKLNGKRSNMSNNMISQSMSAQRILAPAASGAVIKSANAALQRFVIRHSELVFGVYGTVNYTVSGFPVNPGIAQLFPWLSTLSTVFEQYEFLDLKFIYVSSAPTTTTGTIAMSIDYDTLDALPLTKGAQMSSAEAISSTAWQSCELPCSRQRLALRKNLYTRYGLVTGADYKTYDLGTFQIGTQGQAGNSQIGEVYVDYLIALYIPQASVYEPMSFYSNPALNAPTVNAPFGTVVVADQSLSSAFTLIYNAGTGFNQLFCTAGGEYLVSVFLVGTVFTDGALDLTLISLAGGFGNDAFSSINHTVNSAGTNASLSAKLRITTGNTCRFAWLGTATTITSARLTITPLDAQTYPLL